MDYDVRAQIDKTTLKEGVKYCSRRRFVVCLVCIHVFFLLLFYFSCQINYFDCQSMAHTLTSIHGLWTNESEKRKRGTSSSRFRNKTTTTNTSTNMTMNTNTSTTLNSRKSAEENLEQMTDVQITQRKPSQNTSIENERRLDIAALTSDERKEKSNESYESLQFSNWTSKREVLNGNGTKEGIFRFRNISCSMLHPKVLLYNRIFKTASSSVSEYMKTESAPLNYTVELATTEDWYNTGNPFPYPDIISRHIEQTTSQYAFVGHFFFRRRLYIARPYTYINIVREPVRRVISHYAYMRTTMRPRMRIAELKEAGQWNETLVECVKGEHRGCENNVMVRFFCGPQAFCKSGSKRALKQAKTNIKRYYAIVGLKEDLISFLNTLKIILPDYFCTDHVRLGHEKRNNGTHFESVTSSVMDMIRKRNKADVKLYEFVKTRFRKLVKKCTDRGFMFQ